MVTNGDNCTVVHLDLVLLWKVYVEDAGHQGVEKGWTEDLTLSMVPHSIVACPVIDDFGKLL